VTDVAGASRKLEMGDFVCPYAFAGALPPPPSDPKLIEIPFDKASFVKFRYDSKAEAQAKYELLAEPDLGITIDLVDPQAYEAPAGATCAPEDKVLLSSDALAQALGEKRAATTSKSNSEVTWLRKTPLLGNNLYDAVHKYQKNPIERQHVLQSSQALAKYGDVPTSFGELLQQIEQSFTDANDVQLSTLKHPGGADFAHLTPVSVLPVLPDHECWGNDYVQATFDVDPSLAKEGDVDVAFKRSRVNGAVLKYMKKEGKPFFAYLLPPEDADRDGSGLEMEWGRDYAYDIKTDQPYFFAVSDGRAVYNQFDKKINFTRAHFLPKVERPSEITFNHGELDEEEEVGERGGKRQMLLKSNAPPAQLALTDESAGAQLTDQSGGAGASADAEGAEGGADGGEGGEGDLADAPADGAVDDDDDDADPFGDAGAPVDASDGEGGGDVLMEDDD